MRRYTFFLFCSFLLTTLATWAAPAQAWWNDEWELRKKLTLNAGPAGAAISEPIGGIPVLIRLHSGNFKFEAAKQDGADLRFVAGDDKTPLKFHIEKYDSLLGEAFVWVNMPDLRPGAQSEIWLYYGNRKATPAEDAKGTYDPDTTLVYHFGERGTPVRDWSTWGNNAQSAAPGVDGTLIGPGLRFDGKTTVTLPASPSLAWDNGAVMTWSAWIKPTSGQTNAAIYSRRNGATSIAIGIDKATPFVEVTDTFGSHRTNATATVRPDAWHHLAVVATAQAVTLYLDATAVATLNTSLPAMNGTALLGGDVPPPAPVAAPPAQDAAPGATTPTPLQTPAAGDPAAPSPDAAPTPVAPVGYANYAGELDELQIAKVARPAGFLKAAVISQGPDNAKLLALSVEEETGSWLSGYLAVIVKAVTLDAWVVIIILAIMAVISWIVIAEKLTYVGRQSGANNAFLRRFREAAADLTVLDRGDADEVSSLGGRITEADARMMRNSSLYRIYHVGAQEIRHRFEREKSSRLLSAESIAAIRASLDGTLARELQRLNRLVVVLTIAISGGPFLGLLGTVIGVMITFAAIAASGDVNVNAIAPGVAAALLATVAGLAVAIPALFAYNYLQTRIRDATTDMQVFVDEFVTKMAEYYTNGADRRALAAE